MMPSIFVDINESIIAFSKTTNVEIIVVEKTPEFFQRGILVTSKENLVYDELKYFYNINK